MKVGMVGLGKLGLPCAIAMAKAGHDVWGFDTDREKMDNYRIGDLYFSGSHEPGLTEMFAEVCEYPLRLTNFLSDVAFNATDIIFIAVPTPSLLGGLFDFSYVKSAVRRMVDVLSMTDNTPIISVISTVLPMTIRNEIVPEVEEAYPLIYNPYFIAMGTVVEDFYNPEFVLVGHDDLNDEEIRKISRFYSTIIKNKAPTLFMTWENAELTKVLYNTMIGFKIITGNAIMEMCHNIPHANCDVIIGAFNHATQRILGAKYLTGGMGDGGECHPRDNVALSWLCRDLGLSTNPFEYIMESRLNQAGWKTEMLQQHPPPYVIMGKRFKADTNLTTDSASILVADGLTNLSFCDPVLGLEVPDVRSTYLVAIREPWVRSYNYHPGSVVIDVWRQFTKKEIEKLEADGIKYIPLGVGK